MASKVQVTMADVQAAMDADERVADRLLIAALRRRIRELEAVIAETTDQPEPTPIDAAQEA